MSPIHFTLSSAFMMSLTGLSFHRTHLLSTLLCLEAMMLSLFLSLSVWALQLESTSFLAVPLVVLAFSACEASAGLALLIASSRTHGTDQLKNLNLLKC